VAILDAGWGANPKVLALGLEAMGLHAWCISYCDLAVTDGFIPVEAFPTVKGVKSALKRLLDAGRLREVEGGYQLHDYLDYNRSAAKIAEDKAYRRKWREQHAAGSSGRDHRNGRG
jgi:hypothetical protein